MRIARVITRPNLGGPARQAVALWHAHSRLGARTLLVVGRCAGDEVALDLAAAGLPEVAPADVGEAAAGFCVIPALARRIAPLRDLAALAGLRRVLRRFRPDVVHTHTSKAGVLGRLAAPAGAVRAHTFHGIVLRDYAGRRRSEVARRAEAWLARRTEVLLAVSESCRTELAELGVAADVRVVLPAVDTAAFAGADRGACRARLGVGGAILGFVGRLAPIKRPHLLLELAAALPQVTVVVTGDGPLRGDLMHAAPPNLRFVGAVDHAATVVPAFDLLVLPSRREGFPVAAIEAAAAGVRTVGFAVPGLVDLAAFDGIATLVPESEGGAGLVAAVRRLLALGPPPAGSGRHALQAATAPDAVAASLLAAYRAAMETPT